MPPSPSLSAVPAPAAVPPPPSSSPSGVSDAAPAPPGSTTPVVVDDDAVDAVPPVITPPSPAHDDDDQPQVSLFEQWRRATRTITDLYGSVYEGRRTYHGYMPGSYCLPNDDEEQVRLYMQHASWWLILSGVLGHAPILRRRQSPAFVLDVATGTGSWANHFGQRFPESKVVGTDLSLIQPSGFSNVSFVVEDSEEQDWAYPAPIDYAHFRNTLSSFNDMRTVMRKAYEQLRPGGWIEFQEATWEMHCPDDTLKGTAIERWSKAVLEGLRRSGRDTVGNMRALPANLAAVGFVDVEDRAFFVPCNPWAAHDRRLRQLGLLNASIIPNAVESYRKILGFSGLAPDEVDALIEDAKRDVGNTAIHYSLRAHCVIGRKPEAGTGEK